MQGAVELPIERRLVAVEALQLFARVAAERAGRLELLVAVLQELALDARQATDTPGQGHEAICEREL